MSTSVTAPQEPAGRISDDKPVVVVGAGIGGLAAALALRDAGIPVEVFERAPAIEPIGAGIGLWPSALAVLRRLGVADKLLEVGAAPSTFEVRSHRGTRLSAVNTGEFRGLFGEPFLVVKRADLQFALLEAFGAASLRLGVELVGISQSESGVRARFADGSEVEGGVLIGADGVRSRTRQLVRRDGEPRFAGYTAWQAITELEPALLTRVIASESWGRGRVFGLLPVGPDSVYWFAGGPQSSDGRLSAELEKRSLAAGYREWWEPIPQVIEATAPTAIWRGDVFVRRPVHRWGEGRVTLLGDAAHPMGPHMAQGACQAIEDAHALARSLASNRSNLQAALREYERSRRWRAAGVVLTTSALARMSRVQSPWAERLRNALMSRTPGALATRQTAWIATG